jgi:hypothetical protein
MAAPVLGQLEVQKVLAIIDLGVQRISGVEAQAIESACKMLERAACAPAAQPSPACVGDADYVDDCTACVPSTNGNRHHSRCPRY